MSYLVFKMDLEQSNSLLLGKLYARSPQGDDLLVCEATSGVPGHQTADKQDVPQKGPIPACQKVGLQSFIVKTTPTQSEKPGIAGDFFHITPDPMYVGDVRRSEFGIHLDANHATAPGSAGCIVLTKKSEWNTFRDFMNEYARAGFSVISIIVEYN